MPVVGASVLAAFAALCKRVLAQPCLKKYLSARSIKSCYVGSCNPAYTKDFSIHCDICLIAAILFKSRHHCKVHVTQVRCLLQ